MGKFLSKIGSFTQIVVAMLLVLLAGSWVMYRVIERADHINTDGMARMTALNSCGNS